MKVLQSGLGDGEKKRKLMIYVAQQIKILSVSSLIIFRHRFVLLSHSIVMGKTGRQPKSFEK
jgi:hypothetical protein